MLTNDQLEEMRARCDKATPGPWEQSQEPADMQIVTYTGDSGWEGDLVADANLEPDDAAFIAHAREDIPALLDEVDRLHAIEHRYHRALVQQLPGMSHRGEGAETVYFSDGLKGNVEVLERLEEAGLLQRVGDGKPGHIFGRLTEAGLRLMGGAE